MTLRTSLALSAITTLLCAAPSALGDPLKLVSVDDGLRVQDLANLASTIGVEFDIFDYDAAEPHCVEYIVEEYDESGAATRYDGGRICGVAGPQRVTVQRKIEAGRVQFHFLRHRRDIRQGGGVSGPALAIPEANGATGYATRPPELSYENESVLVHGAYGWNKGPRTEFKVLARLLPNPDGEIGTSGPPAVASR